MAPALLPQVPRSVTFRRFLVARMAAVLAGAGTPVLLTLTVLAHGGSFHALGLVLGIGSLPGIASVMVSGYLFRRFSATRVMFWLDLSGFLVTTGLFVVDLAGGLRVGMLVAASFAVATAAGLAYPATGLLMPKVLPPEDLQAGNALRSLVGSTAAVAGPAVATGLLLVFPEPVAWACVAAAFGTGALLIRRVQVTAAGETGDEADGLWAQLRDGWAYFWGQRWMAQVVLLAGVWHVCSWAFVLVLGPVALKADHGQAISWGAFETAIAAGSVTGALLGGHLRCSRLIAAALACLMPALLVGVALAVKAPLPVVLLLGGVTGITLGLAGIFWPTALQTLVPEERLAQMFSYDYMLSEAVMPFGLLAAPLVAAWVGLHAALGIGSVAVAVLIGSALLMPGLRQPVMRVEASRPSAGFTR